MGWAESWREAAAGKSLKAQQDVQVCRERGREPRDRKGDRNEEAFPAHWPHLSGQKLLTDLAELSPSQSPPPPNSAAGPQRRLPLSFRQPPVPRTTAWLLGFFFLFFTD